MSIKKERWQNFLLEQYISERADILINNQNFIKNQTFNFIMIYEKLFTTFQEDNKKEIQNLLNDRRNKKSTIKKLNFLKEILLIIEIDDSNQLKINQTFLEKKFKLIKNKRKSETSYEDWNKFSKQFKKFSYSNYKDFTILKLYNFANSILTFLNDKNFRKEVAEYNLHKNKEEVDRTLKEADKKDIEQLKQVNSIYQIKWRSKGVVFHTSQIKI